MDFEGIGRVATNTTLAACAAGLTAMFCAYMSEQKWDVGFTINGFLAGLVAITCPCYWVSPTGAILLGGVAGVVVVLGVELLDICASTIPSARSPCTAFAVSGERSPSVSSPAANTEPRVPPVPTTRLPLKGLFYGGGSQILIAQVIGSA